MASLHKSERLTNRDDIGNIYKRGHFVRGRNLDLVSLSSQGRKAAFTTTMIRSGAVTRNRIKRKLREAYRRQKHLFDNHHHYIFIGKADILNCRMESLYSEISAIATKVTKHGKDSS